MNISNAYFDLKYLDWDTQYFRVPSGKVLLKKEVNSDVFTELIKYCENIEFLTIVNKSSLSINSYYIGKYTNSYLVDINMQFQKELKTFENESCSNITISNKISEEQSEFQHIEFSRSRFFNDPNINKDLSKGIYKNWLVNSINKDGHYIATYKSKGIVLGYILYSIYGEKGTIELLGVTSKEKAKGIGSKLFKTVENEMYRIGCKVLNVGTQCGNVPAVNFYFKNGCKLIETSQIFHLWK